MFLLIRVHQTNNVHYILYKYIYTVCVCGHILRFLLVPLHCSVIIIITAFITSCLLLPFTSKHPKEPTINPNIATSFFPLHHNHQHCLLHHHHHQVHQHYTSRLHLKWPSIFILHTTLAICSCRTLTPPPPQLSHHHNSLSTSTFILYYLHLHYTFPPSPQLSTSTTPVHHYTHITRTPLHTN